MTGLPALSDNAKRRCNPNISIGEDPVNPLSQLAQNDIFCIWQTIKILFVINPFHGHCLSGNSGSSDTEIALSPTCYFS